MILKFLKWSKLSSKILLSFTHIVRLALVIFIFINSNTLLWFKGHDCAICSISCHFLPVPSSLLYFLQFLLWFHSPASLAWTKQISQKRFFFGHLNTGMNIFSIIILDNYDWFWKLQYIVLDLFCLKKMYQKLWWIMLLPCFKLWSAAQEVIMSLHPFLCPFSR